MPKRLSVVNCIDLAKKNEGTCLSNVYINVMTKYKWRCKNHHIWEARYNDIHRGSWCPYCADRIKKTIDDCHLLARKENGKFLSERYVNNKTLYLWECQKGHQWKAKYNDIQQKQWCPICAVFKREKTIMKKYGVRYISQNIKIREKAKRTNVKRYGTEHVMQNRDIAIKSVSCSGRSYVLYHWNTNEQLVCIGSYEKKVIEYLNKNQIAFKWQSQVFETSFKTGKGNVVTYRPDLFLIDENKWIEIKGYMREKAKQKWDWFHKTYPNSELWDKERLKQMRIL